MAVGDMFGREGPAPLEAIVWVGGDLETAEALGAAFLHAADTLAMAWRDGPHTPGPDRLALPIIQTYRHSIELMLKAGCERVAELIAFGLQMGYGREVRPADLQDELGRTHSIARLVTLLNGLLSGLADSGAGRMPAETREVLQYLHDLDEKGMAFRYVTKKTGKGQSARWEPVRPTTVRLDLDNAIRRLRSAARMLEGGMMTYLSVYEDFLQDMWSEYQSNLADYNDY